MQKYPLPYDLQPKLEQTKLEKTGFSDWLGFLPGNEDIAWELSCQGSYAASIGNNPGTKVVLHPFNQALIKGINWLF